MSDNIKNEILLKMSDLSKDDQIKMLNSLIKDITAECNEQTHYDPHNDRFNVTFRHIMNENRVKRCIDLNNKMQKTCGGIISMIYRIFHMLSCANIYVMNDTALNVVENTASTIISGDFTTEDHKWMINVKFIVTMDTCDYDGYIYFRFKDMYGGACDQLCNSINVRMYDDRFEYSNIVTEFAKKLSHTDDANVKYNIKQICRVCESFVSYIEKVFN